MLIAVLLCAYIIALSWIWGALTLRAFAAVTGGRDERPLSSPVVAGVGMASLATYAGYFCLAAGVGPAAHLLALAVAALYAFADRARLRTWLSGERAAWHGVPRLLLGAGAVAALICLERGAMPPTNYDTGRYHAQAIRWIETYGTVPGLANLHLTLSASAAWFELAALFSMAFSGRSLHVINVALFLLVIADAVRAAAAWQRGSRRPSTVLRVALAPVGLSLFGKWLSSPTPDIPVAVATWAAAVLFLEIVERAAVDAPGARFAALAILVPFALALKVSAAMLALPLLYLLWRGVRVRAARRIAASAAAAVLLLAPGVARNIAVAGFPVIPVAWIDPLDVDWKLPKERLAAGAQSIQAWARQPRRAPAEVLALPAREWVPAWFARVKGVARWALLASLALAPLYAGFLQTAAARTALARRRGFAALLASCAGGVVFWFVTAPDPRFAWGFLIPLPLLLLLGMGESALRRLPAAAAPLALLLFLAAHVRQLYLTIPGSLARAGEYLILPADYPVAAVRRVRAGELALSVPARGDQCWYEAFPCAPFAPPPLVLRDGTLAGGFRLAR